jgi:protein-tyrosine phosphatase
MPDLLFICRANICRSPLAEGVVKKLILEGAFEDDWITGSAGTWAAAGRATHPHTLALLKEAGIDLSRHHSREVTAELIEEAKLVLTMESGQAEALRVEFPQAVGKIYMLSELQGIQKDLEDPVGGTREDFQETMDLIEGYLRGAEQKMREMMKD